MSIRSWFRSQMLGAEAEGSDVPPGGSLVQSLLGRDEERIHSLGEYSSSSYPPELTEKLRRREEVAAELRGMNLIERESRVRAVPRLQELLRRYPHPLAYEALIHAYVDAGRFDEARGVAFAARERRHECERSPHPEIRAEIDRLAEWTPEEIDQLRDERQARS